MYVPVDVRRANGASASGTVGAGAPAQLWELGLLLACGHPCAFFDEDVGPDDACEYLWSCEQCGAKKQEVRRVLGAVPSDRMETMDDEELMAALFGSLAS